MRVPGVLKNDREKLKKFLEAAIDAINEKDVKVKNTNFGFYKFRLNITSSYIVSTISGKKNPFLEFYKSWISAVKFSNSFVKEKFNNTQPADFVLAVDVLDYDLFSLIAKNFIAIKYLPEKLDGSKDVEIITLHSLVFLNLLSFPLTDEVFLYINLYTFGEFSIKSLNVKGIFIPIPHDGVKLIKHFEDIYQVVEFLKAHKAITLDAEKVELF